MSKSLLALLAAATIFSSATFAASAAAMTPAAPSTLRAASAPAAIISRVAILCGMNGCAPIHVSRVRRPPRGFTTRAVPLTAPAANTAQIPATNK